MIDLIISEHGRMYLLKHPKKIGVGDLDYFLYLCFSFGLVSTLVHSGSDIVDFGCFLAKC